MNWKRVKFFLLVSSPFLFVFFLLLFLLTPQALRVETEQGMEIFLTDIQFGRILLREKKSEIIGKDSQGGLIYNLGDHEGVVKNTSIPIKNGTAFGVSWVIPKIPKEDELLIDVEVQFPQEVNYQGKKTKSIQFLWKYSNEDSLRPRWLGWKFSNLSPAATPPQGNWQFRYRNKGQIIAEKTFYLVKGVTKEE